MASEMPGNETFSHRGERQAVN